MQLKGDTNTTDRLNVGKNGEQIVVDYLQNLEYEIIVRNFRSRFGEIDIIAVYENYICFIEVKSRREGFIAYGREYVDFAKQQRIIKTSEYFLIKNDTFQNLQPRFDCAEVYFSFQSAEVEYFENAF